MRIRNPYKPPDYTLLEAFQPPEADSNFFTYLTAQFPEDSPLREFLPDRLYIDYFYSHAGAKIPSPLVTRFAALYPYPTPPELTPYRLTSTAQLEVAIVVNNHFYDKWLQLYETYTYEYDPLSDYKMIITGNRDTSDNGSVTYGRGTTTNESLTHGHTVSSTLSGTQSGESETTQESTISKYGFNTSDEEPVPDSKQNAKTNNINSSENSGTTSETHGGQDTTASTTTNSGTDTNTNAENRTWTENRTGKIGYRTIQELIEKQRKLFLTPFLDIMFADLDSILALRVY